MREAIGWWVRKEEARKTGKRTVVKGMLGPEWAGWHEDRWLGVWKNTGVRAPRQQKDDDDGGEDETPDADILREAATEERGKKDCKKGGTRAATAAEEGDDKGRGGTAMAMRAPEMWTQGAQKQGCAACCTRRLGWGWERGGDGKWEWRRQQQTATQATLWHVMCGECTGVDDETRKTQREEMRRNLCRMQKMAQRTGGKRGPVLEEASRKAVGAMVAAAQKALAKTSARATETEKEALRRCIAGDFPYVTGETGKRMKALGKELAEEVKSAQRAATRLQEAWRTASAPEVARRQATEGGAVGMRLRGVGFDTWRQTKNAIKMREQMLARGEEVGEEQQRGWTMASALIQHRNRQKDRYYLPSRW